MCTKHFLRQKKHTFFVEASLSSSSFSESLRINKRDLKYSQRAFSPRPGMRKLLILTIIFHVVVGPNVTEKRNSQHPLSVAWSLHHVLGCVGIILNSFVLYMFVRERHTFIKIINVMIW